MADANGVEVGPTGIVCCKDIESQDLFKTLAKEEQRCRARKTRSISYCGPSESAVLVILVI